MTKSKEVRTVFVGIDVAMAKGKRLPICVCERVDDILRPLPLRTDFEKPPHGMGNKAALDTKSRETFATEVSKWLKKLQKDMIQIPFSKSEIFTNSILTFKEKR